MTVPVEQNEEPHFTVGTLPVEYRDKKQNKRPRFTLQNFNDVFYVEPDDQNNGALKLSKSLDYETRSLYYFKVEVREDGMVQAPDNQGSTAYVFITVTDVDEPPVFSKAEYTFDVQEGPIRNKVIGSVSARDPDRTNYMIKYSIRGLNCPLDIVENTGQLVLKKELDYETEATHLCNVTAHEMSLRGVGLKKYVTVKINVLDIKDNQPELTNIYIYDDIYGTIIGTICDENPGPFCFILTKRSSKFSLYDNQNKIATIVLPPHHSTNPSEENILEIQKSVNQLHIRVWACLKDRQPNYITAHSHTGVSPHYHPALHRHHPG
ncbi:cadherin-5-like [Colossoma macropomum]|uniref:cadherin-5-like n=1 Tax=Colossoma macropomum TaxID=42526 RepID=UPI00186483CE|nr:cadherin-5-like [Colossoma macropomum]